MRKVVATEFLTLDGVMEDPGGSEGFEHGGWNFKFWSDEAGKFKYDELFATDALLLGRVTYEGFAAAWPTMDAGDFGERMNSLPKYVATTTLKTLEWNNSHVLQGDVAEEVAKLKDQPGQDIVVHGSGQLARSLMAHNLIDEFRLMVHPIVLGSGKRLFADGTTMTTLQLVETTPLGAGVVVLTYRPAETG